MRLAALGVGEALEDGLDGKLGGHFTLRLSANAIGEDKDAAVRSQLLDRVRQEVAEVILVMLPLGSRVRELSELNVEHGI